MFYVLVQTTFSPASMSSVAVRAPRLTDESSPAPVHSNPVNDQPGATDSTTVCAPSCAALSLNVCCDANGLGQDEANLPVGRGCCFSRGLGYAPRPGVSSLAVRAQELAQES
jgi:hypothetical protein